MNEVPQAGDDAALLAASARGTRAAFATFYRRHVGAVLAVLLAETGDRELAADLAGEVFAAPCSARLATGPSIRLRCRG